jgi:integrase/recombinase XerD
MALTKQSKVLNKTQVASVRSHLKSGRNALRNDTIFLLSVKAGLRAKEIASLKWIHVLNGDGTLNDTLHLPDSASKGRSGREIPIHREILTNLQTLLQTASKRNFSPEDHVIRTERSRSTSAQVIVNFFQSLYTRMGYVGCSSHSGRRTFITECARKISTVGGSLRDVQYLAGHSSLQTTQRYIEGSSESKRKLIGII